MGADELFERQGGAGRWVGDGEQEVGMGATSAAVPHPSADGVMDPSDDTLDTPSADPALVGE